MTLGVCLPIVCAGFFFFFFFVSSPGSLWLMCLRASSWELNHLHGCSAHGHGLFSGGGGPAWVKPVRSITQRTWGQVSVCPVRLLCGELACKTWLAEAGEPECPHPSECAWVTHMHHWCSRCSDYCGKRFLEVSIRASFSGMQEKCFWVFFHILIFEYQVVSQAWPLFGFFY